MTPENGPNQAHEFTAKDQAELLSLLGHHDAESSTEGVEHLEPATGSDMFRDFQATFMLGNGGATGQEAAMRLMAGAYRRNTTGPELQAATAEANQRIADLRIPNKHAPIPVAQYGAYAINSADNLLKGSSFVDRWAVFQGLILGQLTPPRAATQQQLRQDIITSALQMDVRYITEGRKGREKSGDPHESIYREYILGDSLRGSDYVIALRDALRETALEMVQSGHMPPQLAEVVQLWEAHHPGQRFFDLPAPRQRPKSN
ncbi:MAG TPA: hypothetical protein VLF67_04195 [Candidatus Saccharimonas sp.]|nr:hypothetical protein [Candidatus Saccharimonas sp.]